MKKRKFSKRGKSIITLLLCMVTFAGFAQTKTVQGTVTDTKNEPVIGASVVVTGTGIGTSTNVQGLFTLANVPENATLTISYMGMAPQTISAAGKTVINATLVEDDKTLGEVVVVGYGTQKKANLTGAVQMTDSKVLADRPLTNSAQGLRGIIPNLNISFNDGSPISGTKINIRGTTSINGGNALVLVDGMETDITLINPQDIESVSVLKDASSAAVYGARAAFGVVLVTTKKGTLNQKVNVTYNNNFAWSTPSRLPKGVAADKWLEALILAGTNAGNRPGFATDDLLSAVKNHIADPAKYPSAFLDANGKYTKENQWAYAGNTDWFDVFYKDAASMQQHNISISGGSEKSTYYGSVGYKGQTGLLAFGTDTYDRTNVAFNFNTKVNKWLDLSFNTKYNGSNADEPNVNAYMGSSPYYEVYRAFPFVPMYLPDGNFAGIEGNKFNYNYAGRMALGGRKITDDQDFWFTGGFNLTPFKGFSLKGDYTQNRWFRTYREHKKILTQTMPNPATPPLTVGAPSEVYQARHTDFYRVINVWGEYNISFNNAHTLTMMAGYNDERKTTNKLDPTSTDLFANDFPVGGLAKTFKVGESGTVWAVKGFFYRLNYDYMQKYLLELNGRYDGSSRYPKGKQWGLFPSASVGWRVSEERFYEPIKPYLEYLKLRASYGSLGNQVPSGNDNFQYLGYLSGASPNYVFNGAAATGLNPATLASTNITWERVTTSNFGVDVSLLNNRLTGAFDYFVRSTFGMVVSKTYPAVIGTTGGKENLADLQTKGWEMQLNWNDKIQNVGGKTLTYGVGLGLSDSRAVITKYDNPTKSLADDYYEGKALGEIWGYVTDGFIADAAEATKMATIQGSIAKTWLPGDIRYRNLDDDPNITRGDYTADNPGDLKVIGNNTPRYRFDISANVGWNGFDLRALFEGVGKRDVWLGGSTIFWGFDKVAWGTTITDYHIDNSWSAENPNAYYPIPLLNNRSREVQTKYLQNGSYIRLRDLTLSYTIPQQVIAKVGLSQCRVFVSGQNLWLGTKLFKYLDPDITDKGKNSGQMDTDGKVYPYSRTISAGFSLTF